MSDSKLFDLSPSQQRAFDWIAGNLETGNIFELRVRNGRGRTAILHNLHQRLGGKLITVKDFVDVAGVRHPLSLDDALAEVLLHAIQENEVVIVDDLHVMTEAMSGSCYTYPRNGFLDSPMTVLAACVSGTRKRLIVGTDGRIPHALDCRCFSTSVGKLTPEDYWHLCGIFLDESIPNIDFQKVHRFAPKLNAHQMKQACVWCRRYNELETEGFIEYLRNQQLTSNVALGEVADVELGSLKGVDDVIKSLEANIVVPLENDDLAEELGLSQKRGVLLVGPPGTGKTTVGRALAHRLKGKFFLIDGTFISGTQDFYSMVHQIFQAARENAPSVIFIDDSDVIFESGQEHGLYRYLLTMLDGLESESAGRVCVMMTAMDVGNLPPALVRSGRIELWLEMRYPDPSARGAILQQHLSNAPESLADADVDRLVESTDSFTGADLKRTIEDGKALYAYDRVNDNEIRESTEYFIAAAATVRESKEKYARAEKRANATRQTRPVWFNPYSHMDYEPDEED